MSAAIYTRVSTLDQAREGYSLEAQRKALTDWCLQRGHGPPAVYEDAGISGKDIRHRPAMQQLLDDVCAGKYDLVVVWALSRLTRSVADLYSIWGMMQAHGCDLVSYTEAYDTTTPVGRAMMGLLGVFAQMEREITGERVAAAMRERAMQGKRTCSEVLGYDTTPGGLRINPAAAARVRDIYRIYAATGSLSEPPRWCRAHGIRGKRGREMDAYLIRCV